MTDLPNDQFLVNASKADDPLENSERLKLIKRKRYALEQLINFSKNIVSQGQALDDILLLSRPSQSIPDKIRLQLVQMVKSLDDYSDQELQERLLKIDKLVENGVQSMVSLAQKAEDFESDSQELISKIDHIKILTDAFRKRTKLAIALRIALQERGVTTDRLMLQFNQEMISERVAELKEEEHACRQNIAQHIEEVIDDCQKILATGEVSESLRNELVVVQRVMRQNLDHLSEGKSVDTLPVNFEIIVMGDSAPGESDLYNLKNSPSVSATPSPPSVAKTPSTPKTRAESSLESEKVNKKSAAPIKENAHPKIETEEPEEKPVEEKKRGFSERFVAWLNSPWSVGWKQTGESKKNKKS